jgi:hypothetical protein
LCFGFLSDFGHHVASKANGFEEFKGEDWRRRKRRRQEAFQLFGQAGSLSLSQVL